jgi:outer membrane protein assembly factor BamB
VILDLKIRHKRALSLLALVLVAILVLASCTAAGARGIAQGWAGGVVADGTVFVGSMEGKVMVLDATDGTRRGQPIALLAQAPSGGFGCAAGGMSAVAIYSSPAFANDLLFVGGYDGKVNAFTFVDGQLRAEPRWIYPRSGDLGGPVIGGLVVAGGRVYVTSGNGSVFALDAADGFKEWVFDAGDKIWAAPAVEGGTVFVGSFDKKLYAIDADSGDLKWEFATGGTIATTPAVAGGIVYVGSFDRHLYAVDAVTGQEKWRFPAEGQDGPRGWFWAKPLVHDGIVYAANLDHNVYAVDAATGSSVSVYDLGLPISSSPVAVGDSVIVATSVTNRSKRQGKVYSLTAGADQPKLLQDVSETIFAPLFASDTTVYVQTMANNLYAIDATSGASKKFSLSTENSQ